MLRCERSQPRSMHGRGRAVDPSRRPLRGLLKVTVKRSCSNKELKRDDDSNQSHRALAGRASVLEDRAE
ncbi:hypothetical protein chiPu_0028703 [Chiloscyllium punctatum]|uniref:Uncharacterized protein n=1 Tax=Chiloscyllium punctatum TaxID=137246 RepID=A0A401TP28_CHIPU|nr:hypothetical protein [Chiloscyllium punctatum]